MPLNDFTKKRSDEDIYDIFHKVGYSLVISCLHLINYLIPQEIKKSRLADVDFLFINIIYSPKDTSFQFETRCMFYKFKDHKSETFKALVYDKLDSSLNGQPIRATKFEILIEDQEDMYGAIIKHANDTEDNEMNVYLTNSTRRPYLENVSDCARFAVPLSSYVD